MPERAKRVKSIARKTVNQLRGSACKRGYDRRWRKVRELFLKQHPLCRDCLEKEIFEPAVEVHHIQKIADRPELRMNITNLMALCKRCHGIRSAKGE